MLAKLALMEATCLGDGHLAVVREPLQESDRNISATIGMRPIKPANIQQVRHLVPLNIGVRSEVCKVGHGLDLMGFLPLLPE